MASEFKIEVPINVTDKSSGSSGGNSGPSFGKMAAAIGVGGLATKALSVVMESLVKSIEPLINVLKALFVVIFLPLMPLVTELSKGIGELIDSMNKTKGERDELRDAMTFGALEIKDTDSTIARILKAIGIAFVDLSILLGDFFKWWFKLWGKIGSVLITPVLEAVVDMFKLLGENIASISIWLSEKFTAMGDAISSAWNWIIDGIINGAAWISDAFITAGEWLGDKILTLWEIIKSPFVWLGNKIGSLWDKINIFGSSKADSSGAGTIKSMTDGIITPNGQFSTAPDDFIIATKNPQSLGGGNSGAITINVTGNKFNSETDMKKMVNMISKELSKQAGRSFSR